MSARTSLGALALALAAAGAAQAAPTLLFEATDTQIAIGGFTTVDVKITGLSPQSLAAYDVNFVWDASVLDWTSITQNFSGFFGAVIGVDFDAGFGEPNGDPPTNGNVGLWLNSYETDADLLLAQEGMDPFKLFSFTMQGKADGATFFTLGPDPDFDRMFVNGKGDVIDLSGGVCIAVGTGSCDNQVPEPATYALVLAALGAAGLARRRAKKAA